MPQQDLNPQSHQASGHRDPCLRPRGHLKINNDSYKYKIVDNTDSVMLTYS
jgi:hypothetical protein